VRLLRDPPHSNTGEAMGFQVQWYSGKPARELRDLFDDALAAAGAVEKAVYEVTGVWDDERSTALLRSERADDLIRRLLDEAMSLAPVTRVAGGGVIA
jgi:hypothetical protein